MPKVKFFRKQKKTHIFVRNEYLFVIKHKLTLYMIIKMLTKVFLFIFKNKKVMWLFEQKDLSTKGFDIANRSKCHKTAFTLLS